MYAYIVALSSDRVLALDKRFVDPRRKPKEQITEEDRNEGVRVVFFFFEETKTFYYQ